MSVTSRKGIVSHSTPPCKIPFGDFTGNPCRCVPTERLLSAQGGIGVGTPRSKEQRWVTLASVLQALAKPDRDATWKMIGIKAVDDKL